MGARGVGHITRAVRDRAAATSSLVLNVGKAHLGEFGTQADIAQAKGELVEALAADGVAVLNADDPLVAAMAARTGGPGADLRRAAATPTYASRTCGSTTQGRPPFDPGAPATSGVPLSLRLVGEHQAPQRRRRRRGRARRRHAARRRVAGSLSERRPRCRRWRMEVARARRRRHRGQRRLQRQPRLDARRAQGAGRDRPGPGRTARTVAVLGEMLELGESSRDGARRGRQTGRAARHPPAGRGRARPRAADPPGRLSRGLLGRGVGASWRTTTRRVAWLARARCGPATWCWSRRRAAPGSTRRRRRCSTRRPPE